MKCRGVRERLSEYVDGELADAERAAIAAHLSVCAGCREEAEGFRRAGEALKTLSAVEVAPDLTSDLHRRLAAPAARRFRVAWVGVGVAAAAGAAACLLWLGLRTPAPVPPLVRTDVAAHQVVIERPEPVLPLTEELPEAETPKEPYRAPVQVAAIRDETEEAGTVEVAGALSWAIETALVLAEETDPLPVDEAALVLADEMPVVPTDVEEPRPALREPRQALARTSEAEYGVILLLGPPEPILPSSRCYLEVSFPDGAKSIVDQTVERDAAGEPRVVQLSYQQVLPKTESVNQGG
jgi:hypothetical protein